MVEAAGEVPCHPEANELRTFEGVRLWLELADVIPPGVRGSEWTERVRADYHRQLSTMTRASDLLLARLDVDIVTTSRCDLCCT